MGLLTFGLHVTWDGCIDHSQGWWTTSCTPVGRGSTGPGIPADRLPHPFDRHRQAKETSKMGYGLGLSISKGSVESLRGSVRAESTPGEGSTFFLTLPVPGRAEAEVGGGLGGADVGARWAPPLERSGDRGWRGAGRLASSVLRA